jgi:hypothetical protein
VNTVVAYVVALSRVPETPWTAFRTALAELEGERTKGIGSQRVPSIAYVAGVGAGR